MARIFVSGAETGDMSAWDWRLNASVVAAKTGMTGAYCFDVRSNGMSSLTGKDFGANLTEIYVHMLIYRNGNGTYDNSLMYFFASDQTETLFVRVDNTNFYLQFYTKYGGAFIANSTPTQIPLQTTTRVEFYYKPSTGSDGRIIAKINGTTVIDFTGVTSEKTNIRGMGLGNCQQQAFSSAMFYYDDIIIDDANWITLEGEQPHKITAVLPSSNGAENALTPSTPLYIDEDKARWTFESGDLGNDEKGNADLTAYGSPSADSSNYKQGSSCVNLVRASSQYFKVLDSALPSTFPLKGGSTNRVFTLCFWYRPSTLPGSGVYHRIFSKRISGSDEGFYVDITNSQLRVGWATSASAITNWTVVTLTNNKWYYIAVLIHGDNRTWVVRIYDDDASTWTTYTGTQPGSILRVPSDDLYIGAYRTPADYADGRLDNMRLYPYILSYPVLDLVRQNRTTFYNYETVALVPPDDNIFIKGHTDNSIQTFVMQDLVGSVESVKSLKLSVRNFLTGSPTVKKVTPVVRLSGANYLGAEAQAPAFYRPEMNSKIWELNPATSSAWLKTDINAMECGAKLTS